MVVQSGSGAVMCKCSQGEVQSSASTVKVQVQHKCAVLHCAALRCAVLCCTVLCWFLGYGQLIGEVVAI